MDDKSCVQSGNQTCGLCVFGQDPKLAGRTLSNRVAAGNFNCDLVGCVWRVHGECPILLMKGNPIGQLIVLRRRNLSTPPHEIPVAIPQLSGDVRDRSELSNSWCLLWDVFIEVRGSCSFIINYNLYSLRGLESSQLREILIVPEESVVVVFALK